MNPSGLYGGAVPAVLASQNDLHCWIHQLVLENQQLRCQVEQLREENRALQLLHQPLMASTRLPGSFQVPAMTLDSGLTSSLGHRSSFRVPPMQQATGSTLSTGNIPTGGSLLTGGSFSTGGSLSTGTDISSGLLLQSGNRTFPRVRVAHPELLRISCPIDRFSSGGRQPPPPQESVPPELSSGSLPLSDLRGPGADSIPGGQPQPQGRDAHRLATGWEPVVASTPRDPAAGQQPTWEQLVGEIAYQLDRRILAHVFPERTRFYGFTVANLPEKIITTALDAVPGGYDEHLCAVSARRYVGVLGRLRPFGYNPTIHAPYTEALVNSYGILPQWNLMDGSHTATNLWNAVNERVPAATRPEVLLLLECLMELAREDGQPLFRW